MRLDWIFLPRENPCAKFYIITITIIIQRILFHESTRALQYKAQEKRYEGK